MFLTRRSEAFVERLRVAACNGHPLHLVDIDAPALNRDAVIQAAGSRSRRCGVLRLETQSRGQAPTQWIKLTTNPQQHLSEDRLTSRIG